MKHVVIIHGWKGKPESNWKPWLQKELENRDYRVDVPAMPNPDHPLVALWTKTLAHVVGKPTLDTYLVGHSLGCITILRYLETLKDDEKIGAVLLVTGFGRKFGGYAGQHDSFFDHELNWQHIRRHCNRFVAIHSDDDPYIQLDQMELFEHQLGAKSVILPSMGHFGSADGVFELPVVRDELLAIAT